MYTKRIIKTITLLLISIYYYGQSDSVVISNIYGTCEDGIQNAVKDSKKGEYKLLSYGFPVYNDWMFEEFYRDFVFDEYGIKIGEGGCVIYQETECYANKMRELIYDKFGEDIFNIARIEAMQKYKVKVREKIDTGFIFSWSDTIPEFEGGKDSLYSFIQDNINITKKYTGKVFIEFVVEKDGSITNTKILRSLNNDIDEKVINLISTMPNWKAGIIYGEKARIKLVLPIVFK